MKRWRGTRTKFIIKLLPGDRVSVSDNGRGIPVDTHKQYGVSALELVLTKLHAGGKFGGETSGYKISGGLHGVGVSVVNALSDEFQAIVERDGGKYEQFYSCGAAQGPVKKIGKSDKHGTTIIFRPDASIFKEGIGFDYQRVVDHYRQQCYLTKGIKLVAIDAREPKQHDAYAFYFEGGVESYVRHLNHKKQPKHENIFFVEKQLISQKSRSVFNIRMIMLRRCMRLPTISSILKVVRMSRVFVPRLRVS
jgi:DNA gyrase subunit B